jgi:hypothetical protein
MYSRIGKSGLHESVLKSSASEIFLLIIIEDEHAWLIAYACMAGIVRRAIFVTSNRRAA